MRVLDTAVYRGPHYYGSIPMVRIRLDLESLADTSTDELAGFADALLERLPGLTEHHCSLGRPGGFVERMRDGTLLGHVVEHVALELQSLAGARVTRGKTRADRAHPGVYAVLVAYEHPEVALAALAMALRLVGDLLPGTPVDLGPLAGPEAADDDEIPGLAALRLLARRHGFGPTTSSLVRAARRRGVPVRPVGDGTLRLGYGVNQRLLRASITGTTSHLAVLAAGDKQRTRSILAAAGIPVPRGTVVRSAAEAVAAARRFREVVTKPLDGNHGRGVSIGLTGDDAVRAGFETARRHSPRVIVEERLVGTDYRVLVVGERMVAAAERTPARVTGDGVSTVTELVDRVNADPRRGEGHVNVLTLISLDDAVDALLERQGLSRESVPEEGRIVALRETGNLSTGGEAIDRTDQVHPANRLAFERAARAIGLDVAGLDVLTPDISRPLSEIGGGIIEVNAAPGFRMHLEPSEGEPRDVAAPVIDLLYPPGTRSLIPITAVTGTNGKSTTVRMLGHVLTRAGYRVGMTTTSGVYVDGERLTSTDAAGPTSARMILDDPTVEAAVLETARGGIVRAGLAVPRVDVGILLNVTADHLGLGGIDTLHQLARVKSVVVRAVRRRGLSVLHADDPRTLRLARVAGGRPGFTTLLPLTDDLAARRGDGALIAALEDDALVLHDGPRRLELLPAADIPATHGGIARFNIHNALAAAAAAHHHGIPVDVIVEALRDFEGSYEQNPGRMNLTRAPGFTTIVDYAHNPAAVAALGETLAGFRATHERLIGVLSTPGDRRDDDIREVGRKGAAIFDELIFRERPDGRGRPHGEVVRLLREGAVEAGMSPDRIREIPDEHEAMDAALRSAGPRDLVLLHPTSVDRTWRQVLEFAAERRGTAGT